MANWPSPASPTAVQGRLAQPVLDASTASSMVSTATVREARAVVVAVGHDHRAQETRRHAPRRLPNELFLAGRVEVVGVEHLGEVLTELVARAHLQGLAVAHHAFARPRVVRAGEPLTRRL